MLGDKAIQLAKDIWFFIDFPEPLLIFQELNKCQDFPESFRRAQKSGSLRFTLKEDGADLFRGVPCCMEVYSVSLVFDVFLTPESLTTTIRVFWGRFACCSFSCLQAIEFHNSYQSLLLIRPSRTIKTWKIHHPQDPRQTQKNKHKKHKHENK